MFHIKKLFLLTILFSAALFAEKFNAILESGTVAIPIEIQIDIPSNWIIGPSSDASKYSDFLYTRKQSVYMRLGFTKLNNISTEELFSEKIAIDYKKHVVNNKTVYTRTDNDSSYIDVRMIVTIKNENLGLYIPMFPYEDFEGKSLEKELNELVQILSTLSISSLPGEDASKKAKDAKYKNIKQEIDMELMNATLIDDEGKIETVDSYCMGLQIIPFKYSQDKTAPQWIKDYANNAITQCKGKLYTGALTKHLRKEGKTSCASLKEAFADDFFIKGSLRDTGDSKMWDTLQSDYAKICK